jgi:hypothetical protein
MGNTKPIGVAYSDQDITGADDVNAVRVSGTSVFASELLGYTTAAQGTVTQLTDKSTGVTLNRSMGRITMNAASLAGNTAVTFTLTNSLIGANDVLVLHVSSGATAGAYIAYVTSLAAGSCVIALRNLTGGALAEAVVLNFSTIHGQ